MRRAGAVLLLTAMATLAGVACGAFEAAPSEPPAEPEGDAAKPAPPLAEAGPKDGRDGSDSTPAADCTPVVDEAFAGSVFPVPSWTKQETTKPNIDLVVPPGIPNSPTRVLGAETLTQPNVGKQAFLVRTFPQSRPIQRAQMDYDFAYENLAPHAFVGCMLALAAGDAAETRIMLEATNPPLVVFGGFVSTDGGVSGSKDTKSAALPAAKEWIHVRAELTIAADGFVERSLTLGEVKHDLARFDPSPYKFDGIRVFCGIDAALGVGTNALATVYMKDLHVRHCKR